VLLWPGAGSSAEHPSLVALAERISSTGRRVERIDFPYRIAGRRAPDRAPVLMASVRTEVEQRCGRLGVEPGRVVIGGRSMGGRICSMVAAGADGVAPLDVAGVLLIAYPLHPPGRPDRLRTEHLADVCVPTLFVSGDRDPFGTPDELSRAQELLRGPVTSVTIPGARHELARSDAAVADATCDWLGPVTR
jgi:predicted alpha/beta-hydrolase family hydrolase